MIKYIVTDIGGCLTGKRDERLDLLALNDIRVLLARASAKMSIVTGGPRLFAEHILQALDLQVKEATHIYEYGGWFNQKGPNKDFFYRNSKIPSRTMDMLAEAKESLSKNPIFIVEPGTETYIFAICAPVKKVLIESILKTLMPKNWERYLQIRITDSIIEINPKGISKGTAVKELGIDLNQTLAIGDSGPDADTLKAAAFAACPANATEEIKALINSKKNGYVAENEGAAGVLAILEHYKKEGLL